MSNVTDLSLWLRKNLEDLLPCLVTDSMVKYIMSIEHQRDLEDFLDTMVSSEKYKSFIVNYRKIKSLMETKVEDDDGYDYTKKQIDSNKKSKKKGSETSTKDKKIEIKDEKAQKKKIKYINLYSQEGKEKDVIMLKGRHFCECEASKHKLVNNCLECGRIVCEQEGSGPCLFCGSLVLNKESQALMNLNREKSKQPVLTESVNTDQCLNKALETRDRLLHYDKTSAQRTKVIDDESEYFSSNSAWLSQEEREILRKKEEEAHAKKHASRLEKKFTLDFAGRAVVEEEPEVFDVEFYEQALNKLESVLDQKFTHPLLYEHLEIKYENSDTPADAKKKPTDFFNVVCKGLSYKIQDRQLLEMSDNGVCLSVHQPWASLLVSGVKRFEGRTWYSPHRGRLWIASTSRNPTKDEIKEAEDFFKHVRPGENLEFPQSYPSSALLGCVLVTDCLPQEEYRSKYPDGECDDPFVFICEDPCMLDTFFPISGGHKIYTLNPKVHQAAIKLLLRTAKKTVP